MARSRRGGGGGGGLSLRRPAPARAPPSVPQRHAPPASVPAPQAASGGGMLSGIGSTIAQGMAFGTGSAIAHRAVGAVAGGMGGGSSAEAPTTSVPDYAQGSLQGQLDQTQQGACAYDKQMFFECLQNNKGDQQACQFLYDQLKQCQQGQPQFY